MCDCCQAAFGTAQLPEALASICNGLAINGTVCQGFNYIQQLATFKGQPPTYPLMANSACNSIGYNFWLLNAGESD